MTKPKTPAKAPAWPADKVERRPVADLAPYARNARQHSPQQVDQIAASITEWGWTVPVLVDEAGTIIAGHGRVLAAQKLGLAEVPVMVARGWTDAQRSAYVIADNKLTLNGTWDVAILKLELGDLRKVGFDLGRTGFAEMELKAIDEDRYKVLDAIAQTEEQDAEAAAAGANRSDGSLLSLLDITIAEPRHAVERGDLWKVGRHWLHIRSVMTDWPVWSQHLKGDAIFCPYPGPFVPLGTKAETHTLVLVQPDPYIAGHLLDRYVDVKGGDDVGKVMS